MKILNILPDSSFAKHIVALMKLAPVESKFVFLRKKGCDVAWVDIANCDDVEIVDVGGVHYESLINDESIDAIWIHMLSANAIDFALRMPKRVKIVWGVFGCDYVGLLGENFYGRLTLGVVRQNQSTMTIVKKSIKDFLFWSGLYRIFLRKLEVFFKRVGYFTTVVPTEEQLVRRLIGDKPKFLHFRYMTDGIKQINHSPVDLCGPVNVLVGNSASLSNNHADVFDSLSRIKDVDKVVSPLSYGAYSEIIAQNGIKYLGDKFTPQMRYMPEMEYIDFLSQFPVMIFGMFRQQAVGNIVLGLKLGACLFLSSKNPVYRYLVENGIKVFKTEDLKGSLRPTIDSFAPFQAENIQRASELFDYAKGVGEIYDSIEVLKI